MESAEEAPTGRDQVAAVQRWRAVIDVQIHFNDMLMRARGAGVRIVSAVFGVAGLSVAQYPDRFVTLFGEAVHVAAFIVVPGLMLLAGVFVLDYFYYYRMLLAVVRRAEEIEAESRGAGSAIAFDLTTCLSRSISRRRAVAVLLLFYGIPAMTGLIFLSILVWMEP